MRDCLLQIVGDFADRLIAFLALHLRALAPGRCVSLSLFGNCDLRTKLLRGRRLIRHEARELVALCFSRCSRSVRRIPRSFGGCDSLIGSRHERAELRNPNLESRELVTPGVHLSRGKRNLDSETTTHQLGVSLGAPSLTRQRSHLSLDFRDQIIDAGEIHRRLFEPALGSPLSVAVETDAGRFLEELAPLVGAIGEQSVDHLALDHHA
jgi:hypothetical protein